MLNRRDLLKYFAAGTVIAPVSGAAPVAKLIEVPNVELVEAPAEYLTRPFRLRDVARAKLSFEMYDGRTEHVTVDGYAMDGGEKPIALDGGDLRVEVILGTLRKSSPVAHYRIGSWAGRGTRI